MSLHNKTNVNFSTLGLMYTKSDCPHKKYAWWSILIWIWLRTKLARRYSIIAASISDFLATCVEPCYKCQVIQNAAMAQLHPYVCHQGQESANVLCRNHQSCRKASRTLTSSDLNRSKGSETPNWALWLPDAKKAWKISARWSTQSTNTILRWSS